MAVKERRIAIEGRVCKYATHTTLSHDSSKHHLCTCIYMFIVPSYHHPAFLYTAWAIQLVAAWLACISQSSMLNCSRYE